MVESNGNPLLYVKLHKAMYGYIRSEILFYEKLTWDLTEMGFIINS